MVLENKLGMKESFELAREEERIGKRKALEMYLPAMERSPVKDVEIKVLLKNALTDKVGDRGVYMKGIDASYHYEGYNTFKVAEL